MKIKIQSDRTKTVKYRTVKTIVSDEINHEFIVTDQFKDQKHIDQSWSIKTGWKEIYPNAYEPQYMQFKYYDDISYLKEANIHTKGFKFPKPSFITDWDSFKGFDHVLCNYIGMDGNVYVLNSSYPIPLWRHFDYISGITNEDYDLEKAKEIIESMKDIKNVKIIAIPYYNQSEELTEGLVFDYKSPSKKMFIDRLRENPYFSKGYFGL